MTTFVGTAHADTITFATVSAGVQPGGALPDGNVEVLRGLDGDDTPDGGGGADSLYGGNGRDRLFARDGIAEISGGTGSDTLDLTRLGLP